MSNSNQRMMALAIKKSLLKETSISNYSSGKEGNLSWASVSCQRAVYMNDGDEFQIQLFNPERFTVGCIIYINGRLMSQRKIVLRPGERIWLDRHIDSPEKLKFSTYEVGKSKAVQEAIQDNGVIKVDFYKEQEVRPTLSYHPTITYQPHIWYNGHSAGDYILGPGYANGVCANDTVLGACLDNTNDTMGDIQTCFCSCVASDDVQVKACASAAADSSRRIETGRVDKGSHSNQSFNQVSADFELFPYHSEDIKILPMSQKPVRPNDLKKRFCPYCGKKLKQEFMYCPHCGQKQ